MSDTSGFDPSDYEGLQERQEQVTAKWRRQLEKRAKEGDEARAELAQVRRELALSRAGIPTTKLGELFQKAYDGPIDDIDAIKAAAIEYGVLQPDPNQQAAIDQSLAGHQGSMEMASGAQTAPVRDLQAEMEGMKAAVRSGQKTMEELRQFANEKFGPDALDRWGMTGRRQD